MLFQDTNPYSTVPQRTSLPTRWSREALFAFAFWYFFLFTNGWYAHWIHSAWIFWAVDIATYTGTAFLALIYFRFRTKATWPDIGFVSPNGLADIRFWALSSIAAPLAFTFSRYIIVTYLFSLLGLPREWFEGASPHRVPEAGLSRHLVVIYASLSAGFFEEIFFRVLPRFIFPRVSHYLVWPSILFGIAHWEQGIDGAVSAFVFGLGMAIWFSVRQNVLPLIGVHTLTDWLILTFHI